MKITEQNYEGFMLDYLEGNLSEEKAEELNVFLIMNPHLENFLDEELPVLTPSDEKFSNKEHLKERARAEELYVWSLDGEISEKEKIELEIYMTDHPAEGSQFLNYKSTILPENNVVFENKEDLKQKVVSFSYSWITVAAACFIGLMVWINFNEDEESTPIADNKEIVVPEFSDENNFTAVSYSFKDSYSKQLSRFEFEPEKVPTNVTSNTYAVQSNVVALEPKKDTVQQYEDVVDSADPLLVKKEETKNEQNNSIVKDSAAVINPILNDDNNENLAVVNTNEKDELSVKEFINLKSRQWIFKDTTNNIAPIKGKEILNIMAKTINKDKEPVISDSNESEKESKKGFFFKLGKIEVSRY